MEKTQDTIYLEKIAELQRENNFLKHEVEKHKLRTDACLYSMIQMQSLLRYWETKLVKEGDNTKDYKVVFNQEAGVWLAE